MEDAQPLPDQRTNRLQPEGYYSYVGGQNSFAQNHRELNTSTLRHLVNGTVRGGWMETRPNFEWIEPIYQTEADKTIFETGKVQGSEYYRFGSNAVIVYAIDGNLFSFDPVTACVININPPTGQPFSRFSEFVYFQRRAGYLISGDGVSKAVITKGYISRHSKPTAPENEVPAGLMMADDWGRLAIVMPDRKRIKFSNHEMDPDPTYSPLGFDESFDYYLSAGYFTVPDHIGRIIWLGFLPQLNTDTGTGPLAVLGEHGMRYYDVSVDRTRWKIEDISGTLLPDIGGISHRAQVTRNDDLIFTDQHGRIRTLKQANVDERSLSVKRFDRHVYPYYKNEPNDLRRFRMAVNFNERILVTIQPESVWLPTQGDDSSIKDRFSVRHKGLAVWNGEVTELSDESNVNIWDGLWTGLCVTALNTGLFSPSAIEPEMCIALSLDDDGINRPYAIRQDENADRYDLAPNADGEKVCKSIELQAITRQFDFSSRDNDFSLLLKRMDKSVIRIGERYGQTDFVGRIISDQERLSRPWFIHKTNADHDLSFETDDCGACVLTAGGPQQDPKLKLPSDQAPGADPVHCTLLNHFYKASLHLVILGWARIEEMIFFAKKQIEENTQNTTCETPAARRNVGCKPNLWRYHAQSAAEVINL